MELIDYVLTAIFIIGLIYSVIIIFSDNVDAYYTVRAKNITVKNLTVKTIPNMLTIDRNIINMLMNCHASEGALAYQSGYADSCDWMLNLLGLKLSPYRSRPAAAPMEDNRDKIIFDYSFKTFYLNMSLYRVQWFNDSSRFWLNDSTIFNRNRNITINSSTWYKGQLAIYGR